MKLIALLLFAATARTVSAQTQIEYALLPSLEQKVEIVIRLTMGEGRLGLVTQPNARPLYLPGGRTSPNPENRSRSTTVASWR